MASSDQYPSSRRVVQQTAVHSFTLSLLPSANCAENRVIENHLQLIHIYDNISCGFLFSEFVPEFLDENYTVSSWDISNPVNQRNFNAMWKDLFPSQPLPTFTEEQCPILIGVMAFATNPAEHQYEILLIDDVLVRTNEEFELELLFYQLITFKQGFKKNVRYPSIRFFQNIGSCSEVMLTISEYLSLNEAVAAFSLDALPLIWRYGRQLAVVSPPDEFLGQMTQTENLDKIIHLRLPVDQLTPHQTSENFAHEPILPLIQNHNRMVFSLEEPYFANLTCLSLYYEGQMTFNKLCLIFTKIPHSIKRFRFECDSMECFDGSLKAIRIPEIPSNDTIETFALHLNSISPSSRNDYCEEYDKCPLNALIELIALMPLIRSICLFIKEHIERLLYAEEWIRLLDRCPQLNAIKLRGKSNITSEIESREKIENITYRLQQTRPSMNFQVQVK